MSEWLDKQKQSISSVRQFLQERIDKANPRRNLTAEATKRLAKLDVIAEKLKRGENVQNRQLQTWRSKDEYAQIQAEWQEQLELREELKDKPSDLKRYEEKLKRVTFDYNRAESFSGEAGGREGVKLEQQVLVKDAVVHILSRFPFEEDLMR